MASYHGNAILELKDIATLLGPPGRQSQIANRDIINASGQCRELFFQPVAPHGSPALVLQNVRFVRSCFESSTIIDISFENAVFFCVNAQKSEFRECIFKNTKFVDCEINKTRFRDCSFEGVRFVDCKITNSKMEGIRSYVNVGYPGSDVSNTQIDNAFVEQETFEYVNDAIRTTRRLFSALIISVAYFLYLYFSADGENIVIKVPILNNELSYGVISVLAPIYSTLLFAYTLLYYSIIIEDLSRKPCILNDFSTIEKHLHCWPMLKSIFIFCKQLKSTSTIHDIYTFAVSSLLLWALTPLSIYLQTDINSSMLHKYGYSTIWQQCINLTSFAVCVVSLLHTYSTLSHHKLRQDVRDLDS